MFHYRTRLIVGVLVILLAGSAVFPRIGVAEQDAGYGLSKSSGNELLKHCSVLPAINGYLDSVDVEDLSRYEEEPNVTDLAVSVGYCSGLVYGVWKMTQTINAGTVKFPPEATLGQVVRIVVQYLETHPARY